MTTGVGRASPRASERTGSDPLRAIVDAAVEGDGVALGELVRLTQPAVWQVCVALGSPGEVEDLVQDTYVRAFGGLARYRGDSSEAARRFFMATWSVLRPRALGREAVEPRIWRT